MDEESEKHAGGRPQHEPTAASRSLVELHATVGTPQELIADLLDIDPKTLRKHYRVELDHSSAKANAVVGGALFAKCKAGDTASIIFWMKTRAGWRERSSVELTGPNGGPIHSITAEMTPGQAAEIYASTLNDGEG